MKNEKQSKGGLRRAKKLTPEKRKSIAKVAANKRWDKEKEIPQSQYTGNLTFGNLSFPCSVLSNGDRILTQSDFMEGMGLYYSEMVSKEFSEEHAEKLPQFLSLKPLKPFVDKNLGEMESVIVKYRTEKGILAHGIKADLIPKICKVWVDAEESGLNLSHCEKIAAEKARAILSALSNVGIIALVDEATGYQKIRSNDALSKILEAFIAKELQPWVKTFPDEFYHQLFRLKGRDSSDGIAKRPKYYGKITNDIIYKRLAPSVLEEIQKKRPKEKKRSSIHQHLTPDIGHPKLKEHMSSVITAMKLSKDYDAFYKNLEYLHPKYTHDISTDSNDDEETEGV